MLIARQFSELLLTIVVDKNEMEVAFGVLKLVHICSFVDWLAWLLFLQSLYFFFLEASGVSSSRWMVLNPGRLIISGGGGELYNNTLHQALPLEISVSWVWDLVLRCILRNQHNAWAMISSHTYLLNKQIKWVICRSLYKPYIQYILAYCVPIVSDTLPLFIPSSQPR